MTTLPRKVVAPAGIVVPNSNDDRKMISSKDAPTTCLPHQQTTDRHPPTTAPVESDPKLATGSHDPPHAYTHHLPGRSRCPPPWRLPPHQPTPHRDKQHPGLRPISHPIHNENTRVKQQSREDMPSTHRAPQAPETSHSPCPVSRRTQHAPAAATLSHRSERRCSHRSTCIPCPGLAGARTKAAALTPHNTTVRPSERAPSPGDPQPPFGMGLLSSRQRPQEDSTTGGPTARFSLEPP